MTNSQLSLILYSMSSSIFVDSYGLYLLVFVMSVGTGAPPTYMSSVGNAGIASVQQQQPPLTSQMNPSAGYYSSAAAALPPPSVYDAGDTIPPVKI